MNQQPHENAANISDLKTPLLYPKTHLHLPNIQKRRKNCTSKQNKKPKFRGRVERPTLRFSLCKARLQSHALPLSQRNGFPVFLIFISRLFILLYKVLWGVVGRNLTVSESLVEGEIIEETCMVGHCFMKSEGVDEYLPIFLFCFLGRT